MTARVGALLLDHPDNRAVAGWAALAGSEAVRVESFSGLLTAPDIIWWTNADERVLSTLSLPSRFLAENTFGPHMTQILEGWGIDMTVLTAAEARDRGVSKTFALARDPETAATWAALFAARVPLVTQVPLGCASYVKHVLSAARSSPAARVTTALRRLVTDEAEYFSKTAERFPQGATVRAFALPYALVAQHLVCYRDEPIAYPRGNWRAVRLTSHITREELLTLHKPLLVRAQVELPERVAKLVVLGSGAKAGLREWFALPELALLIGIGAKVEVMRGAWQAEDQEIIPVDAPHLLRDGALSSSVALLAIRQAMGRDPKGRPTPGLLWLRGIDRSHTLFAGLALSKTVNETLKRPAPLFGFYLGNVWLTLKDLFDDEEEALHTAALQSGFLPRGTPLCPGAVEAGGIAPLTRWVAGLRLAGPLLAQTVDALGLTATREESQVVQDLLARLTPVQAIVAVAAAFTLTPGSVSWADNLAFWEMRVRSDRSLEGLVGSAQRLLKGLTPAVRTKVQTTLMSLCQTHAGGQVQSVVLRLSQEERRALG